jgi:phospholipid transport system substrate-binding protein
VGLIYVRSGGGAATMHNFPSDAVHSMKKGMMANLRAIPTALLVATFATFFGALGAGPPALAEAKAKVKTAVKTEPSPSGPGGAGKSAPVTGEEDRGAGAGAGADRGTEKGAEKPLAPPPPGSSPMAELKKSNMQLDKVLQRNRPNWSPEAELQRAEVRKVVGSFLDYGELARRSLSRHWDTLTPKQHEEFVSTLRELVERSYLKQVHGNANYVIKYDKEEKNGSEATVDATLLTSSRGKKVNVALEYKMLWKDGHWVVYDVLTDEQSMLENYRAEFNKIINKDGFDALLRRMRKKLEEKEE